MCGIAGTLDLRPNLSSGEALVATMTDSLRHRGPDDAGLLIDAPVVLGHRRLSVFDLTFAGHQPMSTEDQRFWITYNGEIYNHFELASELRARGHRFRSSCDTEVLLRAFEVWGAAALERLNGDFVFAIWDRRQRVLFCARDRFGAKPFYYVIVGGRFRFANEIKALLMDSEVPREPNDPRVVDFLARGLADHTHETMFAGIHQLPAGCFMTVSQHSGVEPPTRWYRLQPADLDSRAPAEAVRETLTDAVALRLRSDVPVGLALSGGMDSSSVMAIASRLRRAEGGAVPDSFTARCRNPRIDEGRYAQAVVRATGSRNHEVLPDERDVLENLDFLLWHMDEPFHSPTVYGHWKVLELARTSGVIVLLEGQAGDDVLAGYDHLYPAYFSSFLKAGRFDQALVEVRARAMYNGIGPRRSLVGIAKHFLPRRVRGRYVPDWLSNDVGIQRPPLPTRTLRAHQLHSLMVTPMPGFLHHDDRNSMSISLESRSPFLDHRVVECGLALGPEHLLLNGFNKWVLRDALRDILPAEIVDRRDKQGFSVDQVDWMHGAVGKTVEETFRSQSLASRPYFDRARLLAELASAPTHKGKAEEMWRAFMVERWLRLYVDPPNLSAPPAPESAPRSSVRAADRVVRLAEPVESMPAV